MKKGRNRHSNVNIAGGQGLGQQSQSHQSNSGTFNSKHSQGAQDENYDCRNGARAAGGGGVMRYSQKCAIANQSKDRPSNGSNSGSKSGSRSCRDSGTPFQSQKYWYGGGQGSSGQKDHHSQSNDYYSARGEKNDDHYQHNNYHGGNRLSWTAVNSNGWNHFGQTFSNDKKYSINSHHNNKGSQNNSSAGSDTSPDHPNKKKGQKQDSTNPQQSNSNYSSANDKHQAGGHQQHGNKGNNGAYENDYDHEMYRGGIGGGGTSTNDDMNHPMRSSNGGRGKRSGQQRQFGPLSSNISSTNSQGKGSNYSDFGSDSHYHQYQGGPMMVNHPGYMGYPQNANYNGMMPVSQNNFIGYGPAPYHKSGYSGGPMQFNYGSKMNQGIQQTNYCNQQVQKPGASQASGNFYKEGGQNRQSDSYNDYGGQSQKNANNYSNQMMGPSNGNMNMVKNDYFQYGGPQQNMHKGYRYSNYDSGVYTQQQQYGLQQPNSGQNYKVHHQESDMEANTSGGDAHCSSTSGSVTSWNYQHQQQYSQGFHGNGPYNAQKKFHNTNRYGTMSQGAYNNSYQKVPQNDIKSCLSQGEQSTRFARESNEYQKKGANFQNHGPATATTCSAQSSGSKNQELHQNLMDSGHNQKNNGQSDYSKRQDDFQKSDNTEDHRNQNDQQQYSRDSIGSKRPQNSSSTQNSIQNSSQKQPKHTNENYGGQYSHTNGGGGNKRQHGKPNKFEKRGGTGCCNGNQQSNEHYFKRGGGDSSMYKGEPRRSYICQVCKLALQEVEKDFYPCNCKYQICFKCYQRQVDEKERKCPNCFKHYDSARVEEYRQSRINKVNQMGSGQKGQAAGSNNQQNSRVSTLNQKYQKVHDRKDQNGKVRALPQYQVKQQPKTEKEPAQEIDKSKSIENPETKTVEIVPKVKEEQEQSNTSKIEVVQIQQEPKIEVNEQQIKNSDEQDKIEQTNIQNTQNSNQNQQNEIEQTNTVISQPIIVHQSNPIPKENSKERQSKERVTLVLQNSDENKLHGDQIISPLLQIEPQSIQKNKTDEHIPNQTQKLIETAEVIRNSLNNEKGSQDNQEHTVHQKYDLVSKNNQDQDQLELEQNLWNCKFQQLNGPEPEDSDIMERMSMRSSQTQNIINNQLMYGQNQQKPQNNIRRTNSQENRLTMNRFLNHMSSQSGFSISGNHCLSSSQKDKNNIPIFNQTQPMGGVLQHKSFKGVKLNKIRIIEKTTVYVIGLSPILADKSIMSNYEYFGQYGQIKKIMIRNKENSSEHSSLLATVAGNQLTSLNQISTTAEIGGGQTANQQNLMMATTSAVCSESASSSKSQLSFAAHITYSTPEDASLAILALDKFVFDGRKIRASYGRTKFCKYFLQNTICPDKKNCPYLHKDCKEEEILTPDDMNRKEELFQQCQNLAIQVSKIAQMTESQYRNLLQHKRDLLCHRNNLKHLLPKVESIFENKELMKNINLCRKTILKAKRMNQLQMDNNLNQQRILSKQKTPKMQHQKSQVTLTNQIQIQTKNQYGKDKSVTSKQDSSKQQTSVKGLLDLTNTSNLKNPKCFVTKVNSNIADLIVNKQVSNNTSNSVAGDNQNYIATQKNKMARSGSHRQPVERRDDSKHPFVPKFQAINEQKYLNQQNKKGHGPVNISKTIRRNSYTRPPTVNQNTSNSQLIDIQLKDVKIQRQSTQLDLKPDNDGRNSPKMQDLIANKHQCLHKFTSKTQSSQKVDEFIKLQERKRLSQGLKNLKQNAKQIEEKQSSLISVKKETNTLQIKQLQNTGETQVGYNSVFSDQAKIVDELPHMPPMSKSGSHFESHEHQSQQKLNEDQQQRDKNRQLNTNNDENNEVDLNKRIDRATKFGTSGRRHFDARDRRKSVSKSIQRSLRQNSMSSHVEYTLKYVLNDDMAICNTNQKYNQEPLIENNEESEIDRQSLINKMICQNQMLYSLGGKDKDNFDAKSSFLSNKESKHGIGVGGGIYAVEGAGTGTNSYKQNTAEINLQKRNNIYTTPFFLINAQCREKTDTRESIQKIWDDFDYLEGTLMNHMNNSNMSDQMRYTPLHGAFDSQSQQDYFIRPSLMLQGGQTTGPGGQTQGQLNMPNMQNLNNITTKNGKCSVQQQPNIISQGGNQPSQAAKTMFNQNFESLSVNNNQFNINHRPLMNNTYASRGSFQMENMRMQNMISLYNQKNIQQIQQPNSGPISSSANDSQAAKTHLSIQAKPFYKPKNSNTINQSMCGPQIQQSAIGLGHSPFMQQSQQQISKEFSLAGAFKQQKVDPGKLFSDGQETPGKPIQSQNSSKGLKNWGWTDDLIDQSQHWNQIFLQDQTSRSQAKGRHSLNQDELNKKSGSNNNYDVQQLNVQSSISQKNGPDVQMKKFTSNIITSRSVFSFPILDDDKDPNDDSLKQSWKRIGRTKDDTMQSENKNDRRRSQESGTRRELKNNCFDLSHSQKRKSVCDAKINQPKKHLIAISSRNFESINQIMDEQMQIATSTPIKSNNEHQDTTCSGTFKVQSGIENAPVRKSNPFALAQITKNTDPTIDAELDFDRRSAGERFQTYHQTGRKKLGHTSAYDEFIKVNDLFSGSFKMVRRKSCSKSQSHSRVRGLVNSKHPVQDNYTGENTPNSSNNIPWTLLGRRNRDKVQFQTGSDKNQETIKQIKELQLSDGDNKSKEQANIGQVTVSNINQKNMMDNSVERSSPVSPLKTTTK